MCADDVAVGDFKVFYVCGIFWAFLIVVGVFDSYSCYLTVSGFAGLEFEEC